MPRPHPIPHAAVMFCVVFCATLLPGCVRVSTGAGYWHAGPEGDIEGKQVGFDTADYIPGSPTPGKK